MLFSAIEFWFFYPVVFLLYWFVTKGNLRLQNAMLLVASYFFYSCWDWRFLFLLMFSTLLDFSSGLLIRKSSTKQRKRLWLIISVVTNLGLLGFFKYYNFFVSEFADLLHQFGMESNPWLLSIILPVGISFYTFHGLSYVFDIYNDHIEPTDNLVDYALFVGFFPLLVAGPIERATNLLPQLQKPRTFKRQQAVDGARQALWGLFKKIVIADNLAPFVNDIFANSETYSGPTLLLGAVLFAIQAYGDFSGYSDIALGTARLMGIELLRNFNYPYFSRDIAEFWRRWHISLSSWFRDYLYIPLGGSRGGNWMRVRNIMIIFLVSGFWHGAYWTYIVWGGLNALYFLPLLLSGKNRMHMGTVAEGRMSPSLREVWGMGSTFTITFMSMIFFRATDMHHALTYIRDLVLGLFDPSSYSVATNYVNAEIGLFLPVITIVFFGVEWLGRLEHCPIATIPDRFPRAVRWAFYYTLCVAVLAYVGEDTQFIYFQF
ncbi:MAG: MBOAT family O-acyltransferase [Flavobacteriales bacterium]